MENKTYTTEEINEILKANNLDLKALAQMAKIAKSDTDTGSIYNKKNASTTKKTRSYTAPEFTLELVNYPDFVIRKTTSKTTRDMVFMTSQKSYFLKDNKTGAIEPLTEELYTKFTSGMQQIQLPSDFWIREIDPGKVFWKKFTKIMETDGYYDMIKSNVAPKFESVNYGQYSITIPCLKPFLNCPKLFVEFYNDDTVSCIIKSDGCMPFIKDLSERFGLNNARDFLRSLSQSLIKENDGSWRGDLNYKFQRITCQYNQTANTAYSSPIPNIKMEYAAFKQYVLFQSVRMGYAFSLNQFFVEWNDTLRMQDDIYGKIREKYPQDLPLLHNKLSYISILKKKEIDERKFTAQSLLTQKYEMKIKDWVFLAPRKPDDFYDEAAQQANCLASYVQKYTEGRTHIVFMRKADEPETSVVTIEYVNGVINQAYQAHNARVTSAQQEILDIWYDKIKKIDAGESIEEEEEVNA